jgi:chromosome segregation ATPase
LVINFSTQQKEKKMVKTQNRKTDPGRDDLDDMFPVKTEPPVRTVSAAEAELNASRADMERIQHNLNASRDEVAHLKVQLAHIDSQLVIAKADLKRVCEEEAEYKRKVAAAMFQKID